MKRVLLDQGLVPSAAALLREKGFDAIHVSEIGMERAEDVLVLEKAREDERVFHVGPRFHAHLATAGQGRPSVVLIRAQGLDAQQQADLIRVVYLQCEDALRHGAVVSADGETIRIRRLPLR